MSDDPKPPFNQANAYPLTHGKTTKSIALYAREARDANDHVRSLQILNEGVAQYPANPYLWRDLAITYKLIGNRKAAREHYAHAYALDPENQKIGMSYAGALLGWSKYEEAERVYIKLLVSANETDKVLILRGLGRTYLYDNKPNLAMACFTYVEKAEPIDQKTVDMSAEAMSRASKSYVESWKNFAERVAHVLSIEPSKEPPSHLLAARPPGG